MDVTLLHIWIFAIGALFGAILCIAILGILTKLDKDDDKTMYDFADYVSKGENNEKENNVPR